MNVTSERPPLSKLADVMAAQGRSWSWLAERLSISPSYLSLMVAGKRDYTDYLDRIAHVLHQPLWSIAPDREDAA